MALRAVLVGVLGVFGVVPSDEERGRLTLTTTTTRTSDGELPQLTPPPVQPCMKPARPVSARKNAPIPPNVAAGYILGACDTGSPPS